MSDFIPLFRPRTPKKLSEQKWLDPNEPQVILFQGMRGSGKGVAVDRTAEELYHQGINVWHIWGARSFENLYWAVNKNCWSHYQKIKLIADAFFNDSDLSIKEYCKSNGMTKEEVDHYLEIMKYNNMVRLEPDNQASLIGDGISLHEGKLLHCKCHKAYPIFWIVPDYIDVDQDSLDRFNRVFWKNLEEYSQYLLEITSEEREKLLIGKLKKPKEFQPKPLILVRKITPPTNAHRKEAFRDEFTKIVLDARNESRIVCMNPAIFDGQTDKFETLTEIFRMIPYLMNKSGHFTPLTESGVGKARKYWTKKQKSWHKVVIVINELRSVAPSSKMHGEKSASSSKKAIFDFIPEARHYKTWFLGDYQNPSDLFDGVRHQANLVIIKRASRNILGGDWGWLFDKVEKDRMGFCKYALHLDIEKPEQVWYYERKNKRIKQFLDDRRPRVDALPDNQGYVTWLNNEIIRESFALPSFHHKTSMDDFKLDTGISWIVNREKKPQESLNLSKSAATLVSKQKKKIKEELFKKIDYMRQTQGRSWQEIREELVLQEKEGIIPEMGFSEKKPPYFSNEYGKWKKKQNANKLSESQP